MRDTYLFVPNFPLTLVSLKEDSIVTRKNTDVAFAYFTEQNPSGPYKKILVANSDFVASSSATGYLGSSATVGEVDHLSELPFLSVLILHQFNIAP